MKSGEVAVKERMDALIAKESEVVKRELTTAEQVQEEHSKILYINTSMSVLTRDPTYTTPQHKKLAILEQELGFKEQVLYPHNTQIHALAFEKKALTLLTHFLHSNRN